MGGQYGSREKHVSSKEKIARGNPSLFRIVACISTARMDQAAPPRGIREYFRKEESKEHMKRERVKVKIGRIEAEVLTVEEIHASRCNIMAVRLKSAGQLNQYPVGTRSGFACSMCGADCILAPSGQQIVAAGVNPVVCMECTLQTIKLAKSKPS